MRHYICSDRYQKCEKIGQRVHLLSREIRGVNRKTIITYNSPKRYRKRCGLPKPLPLGEVALRSNDGEGKLTSQEYLHSDRHWLLSERCYRCAFCFSVASLPSQSRSARQLSQRESLWQAGQAHAGRAKFDFIGNSSALLQRFTAA